MLTSIQIKTAIAVAVGLLVWYAYYNIVVVPQNRIEELETTVLEQSLVPVKIVNKINRADANRTQEEINNVKIKDTTIHDSGVLIF